MRYWIMGAVLFILIVGMWIATAYDHHNLEKRRTEKHSPEPASYMRLLPEIRNPSDTEPQRFFM